MIIIDPVTQQRILTMPHTGDITYDLMGDPAISEEDIPLIGPWLDYTGSNINVDSRSQQLFAGQENQLFGTDAALRGAKINQLTSTGTRQRTHRSRVIKRYALLDGDGKAIKFE